MNKKKATKSQLIKKLDGVFSEYIRRKYIVKGYCKCYTCWKRGHWKSMQNGHFITRSCKLLRRSEENCRVQCVWCNVFKNGNYIEYTRRMIDEVGIDMVDALRDAKKKSKIRKTYELEEMIEHYNNKLNKLL